MEFIRKHKIAITIFIIMIIILFILFGIYYLINRTSPPNTVIPPLSGPSVEESSAPIPPFPNENKWITHSYNADYIIPQFNISYPDWYEVHSKDSGSWDITLTDQNRKIEIDLSGQDSSTFEQSLKDWITTWGSFSINYTFKLLEQGKLTNENRNYVIYEVTEENKHPYAIAIVDVAEMYEGRGHLAIKTTNVKELDYISKMLKSIKSAD